MRTDRMGRIIDWNEAATRIFGYGPEEVLGRPLTILDPADGRGLADAAREALGGDRAAGELAVACGDGEEVPCDGLFLAVRGSKGEVAGTIGLLRDATRRHSEAVSRRRLEEQYRQSQKMEAVGQLAGGIAHDFNNLLTSILGYSEMLERALPPGSDQRADVEEIQKAGRRAAALTRQLLSFSRHQPQRTTVVDLVAVVEGLRQLLIASLGEEVRLEIRYDAPGSWVMGDRSQLEQVVLNLALNARDAMSGSGTLSIEISRARLAEGEAFMRWELPAGVYARLAVTDEGIGMDEETRRRAFDPFFTTKEPGKGTGLGLSTVYGIVQQARGAIDIESAPDRGSTFVVMLPLTQPEGATSEHYEIPPPPREVETVLVVEDEPMVRRLICSGLRESGYVVLEASSGEEARRLFELYDGGISLLLTDVVMPAEGGREVAASLLAHKPDLPVLYISGYTEDSNVVMDLANPRTGFLQKPFATAELLAAIRPVLAASRGDVSSARTK